MYTKCSEFPKNVPLFRFARSPSSVNLFTSGQNCVNQSCRKKTIIFELWSFSQSGIMDSELQNFEKIENFRKIRNFVVHYPLCPTAKKTIIQNVFKKNQQS